MRPLITTAVLHVVGTLVAVLALSAGDVTLAVAAVAATFALMTWFAALHSTPDASGLPLASTTALVGLALTGRTPPSTVMPLLASQVVASVATGAVLLAWGDTGGSSTLVWDTPSLSLAATAGVLVGLVGSWTVLAIDGGAPAAWWVAPSALAGAVLNVALCAATAPAVLLGLATAGVLGWSTVLVVGAGTLVGAAAGVYVAAAVTPRAP